MSVEIFVTIESTGGSVVATEKINKIFIILAVLRRSV